MDRSQSCDKCGATHWEDSAFHHMWVCGYCASPMPAQWEREMRHAPQPYYSSHYATTMCMTSDVGVSDWPTT